jgi:L-alanine-DL-glutamate epimerase-like enolase superfamily enzyme
MRNEKPGGHGERSVAMGALDMAVWDLVAKIQERPLFRVLADRYAKEPPDERVFVYAAGGYYAPGKSNDALADEMRHYLDLGYTHVKMKIGGAGLRDDMDRLEAVVRAVGSTDRVAVDANARLDEPTAMAYADALEPFGLYWYEEAGDPLDFELQRKLAERYPGRLATGENLFCVMDVRNLLRYGGMRPDLDVVQVDPSLSYGVVEYLRILHAMKELGWSSRSCIPHGGHQMTLHLAVALHLGGNESYPGVFEPIGGFADGRSVVDGYVRLDEEPGIGIERKGKLWTLCRELSS